MIPTKVLLPAPRFRGYRSPVWIIAPAMNSVRQACLDIHPRKLINYIIYDGTVQAANLRQHPR